MCFAIHEDDHIITKDLRQQAQPIIAYKILTRDLRSPYYPEYQWEFGKEMVARETLGIRVTQEEAICGAVNEGIHLYREPCPHPRPSPYRYRCVCPRLCRYLCPRRCPCPYRRPYLYPLRGTCLLRQFKVQVNPNLIVIANKREMVVTTARLIKEI
jgi:hypothetical protein